MSKKEHVSATPATMWLKQHKVPLKTEFMSMGNTAARLRQPRVSVWMNTTS